MQDSVGKGQLPVEANPSSQPPSHQLYCAINHVHRRNHFFRHHKRLLGLPVLEFLRSLRSQHIGSFPIFFHSFPSTINMRAASDSNVHTECLFWQRILSCSWQMPFSLQPHLQSPPRHLGVRRALIKNLATSALLWILRKWEVSCSGRLMITGLARYSSRKPKTHETSFWS